MTITQTLAALVGLYFTAAGIGLIVDRAAYARMTDDLREQPVFSYLGGIIALAIGGAIVAIHNDWSGLQAGMVTLIGWISLIKGALLIAFRRWFVTMYAGFKFTPLTMGAFGIGTLVIGVALLASVFT